MLSSVFLMSGLAIGAATPRFTDVTDAIGLGAEIVPETVARVSLIDLDNDGWPDAVIDRHRIFLNTAAADSPVGRRFTEIDPARTGLPAPAEGSITVFADLDNDGARDALVTAFVDGEQSERTSWHRGVGDGTFETAKPIEGLRPATTCAAAIGDVDRDGRLDLWLGNWYVSYGESLAGYANDLVLQVASPSADAIAWRIEHFPPRIEGEVDEATDDGGRPTFGTMIVDLDDDGHPELLELNYGRRWNRCHTRADIGATDAHPMRWTNIAAHAALDGDAIRHGRHPEWLAERAKTDKRFDRDDEKPFRANGNSFDGAAGDVDNDGDVDLFLAEITHAWAGESSDRSRFLLSRLVDGGRLRFETDASRTVDRIPPGRQAWNQGDLFCALADFDHDTRLDLLLSSGDYPDDQRLRLYIQQPDGTLLDSTAPFGIDHDGSQQISLADVDGDGDLDILVGQTFRRFTEQQREGRSPHVRLYLNEATAGRRSIVLRLRGEGKTVNRDALGAVVRAELPDGTTISRHLVGIGGHAGKQHDGIVHLGIGTFDRVSRLTVRWPDRAGTVQQFQEVRAGRYAVDFGRAMKELAPHR